MYVGSPSICIMPNGDYIATHDLFANSQTEYNTEVYKSEDRGLTWERQSVVKGQFWSSVFCISDTLYLIGTDREYGNLVIRRSTDGKSWTTPSDSHHGLLAEGEYHSAPTPVVVHQGRIWKAIEYAKAPATTWPMRYSAMMISVPVGADLLEATNWTRSVNLHAMPHLKEKVYGWLDGNAVVAPDGNMVDVMRANTPNGVTEKAAIIKVSDDCRELSFDDKDLVDMPGGCKKFTIRYDSLTHRYWSLVNAASEGEGSATGLDVRNYVVLISSSDLREWTRHATLLAHPDMKRHAFQYIDWMTEGNDLIYVSRTAYEGPDGELAHSGHDANMLTFHRIKNFRRLVKKSDGHP